MACFEISTEELPKEVILQAIKESSPQTRKEIKQKLEDEVDVSILEEQ